MKSISQSIKFMLIHSVVSIGAIIILTAAFSAFQLFLQTSEIGGQKAHQASLMLNIVIAGFLGIYLGGALLSLKQNYLWKINQRYRTGLMAAFVIIIGSFNIIQIPLLLINLNDSYLLLLAPFCATVFSSQMVLGKNIFAKFLLPAIPFAFIQLDRIGVSSAIIMSLISISALGVLASMYFNQSYPDSLAKKKAKENAFLTTTTMATGIQPTIVTSFNHYLGVMLSGWIKHSKKNIDWAITMPHTKLALAAIFYVFLIVAFILLTGDKDKSLIEAFTVLFVSVYLISTIIESSQLFRQTRFVAHVFVGKKHRQLKNKILLSLDKTYVTNCIIFVVGIMSAASLFSMPFNSLTIIYSVTVILLIGLAIYPILLCIGWINISFAQVFSICGYGLIIFLTIRWLGDTREDVFYSLSTYIFLVGCILTRVISQIFFWNRPFELLVKNK